MFKTMGFFTWFSSDLIDLAFFLVTVGSEKPGGSREQLQAADGKDIVMEAVYACNVVGRNSGGNAEKVSQVKGFKKTKSPNC